MRTYDLVLFGVTGYTGRLVAEALLESDVSGLKWAFAGRSMPKLEAVREQVAQRFPQVASIPLIIADADRSETVRALAASTRVLCTTVGPYARHGAAAVEACVAEGTHYCDLTGEVGFMRHNITHYHADAEERGLRIVHACGFDSVPFDLGVLAAQREFAAKFGRSATKVRTATGRMKGTFSGGTLASMTLLMDDLKVNPEARRLLGNPYALVPGERGPDRNEGRSVEWSEEHQQWVGPFIMAGCNTRVVRRTHSLLGHPWGETFSYMEVLGTGAGFGGWLRGQRMRLLLGLLMLVIGLRPLRAFALGRFLPEPGDGPTEKEREEGHFEAFVHAEEGGDALKLRVSGEGDPGYLATSRMLAQCALALAKDDLPEHYGVLTPGAALGDSLLRRLPKVGIRFEVL